MWWEFKGQLVSRDSRWRTLLGLFRFVYKCVYRTRIARMAGQGSDSLLELLTKVELAAEEVLSTRQEVLRLLLPELLLVLRWWTWTGGGTVTARP